MRKARQIGARTRLDAITTHVDVYHEVQTEECSAFGIRPIMSASQRLQMLEEYQEADEIRVMSNVVRKMFLDRGFDPAKVFTLTPPFIAIFRLAQHLTDCRGMGNLKISLWGMRVFWNQPKGFTIWLKHSANSMTPALSSKCGGGRDPGQSLNS
ncbi:MAG: hypothetical protein LR011_14190 [Verrucomicrobia bacterium]|nr:hypothetical protein [Verrucomicrobiota bacterium]